MLFMAASNSVTSVLITDEIIQSLEKFAELAPLHNPPNLKGIYALKSLVPGIPQVAVFDTAFHHTMPMHAFMYAIPYALYKKYAIRRYGFHGTSHRYVSNRACEILKVDPKQTKIITCHLGNGASACEMEQFEIVVHAGAAKTNSTPLLQVSVDFNGLLFEN